MNPIAKLATPIATYTFIATAQTDMDCSSMNGCLANGGEAMNADVNEDELKYLRQIRQIIEEGDTVIDRTGVGTRSIFGLHSTYSLRNGVIPLLTTKRVYWKGVVEELLWFIRGDTDAKRLSVKNVKIWDANGSREFLDGRGFTDRPEGDLGPIYGFQWRHFGAEYRGTEADYSGEGVDQLSDVIQQIKNNPNSRRIILNAWNVKDLSQMALPPCHTLAQFAVRNGELSCQMYQRSGDMGLGVPFNLASYGLLTHMIAHVCGLKTGFLHHVLGDAHVYLNHIGALNQQLTRQPRPFPTVRFEGKIEFIDDFTTESIILEGYRPMASIKMDMAV
ncbi:Thymidylate synthase [Toxocara canis]|uniref:Thymidylate synthase n=1 Tax=Toxocara canis TaxID=6265 RepID=A0A0B2UVX1_TOXCA|nr:Thymidylate synthase [Toxocara canis]